MKALVYQFGIILAAIPLYCGAADYLTKCGPLPVVTFDQAICAAKHYLEMESEACPYVSGFDYTASKVGSYWSVHVIPNDWMKNKDCTGDNLEISLQTGQLLKWERITYQTNEVERLFHVPVGVVPFINNQYQLRLWQTER
jgi:hypothetical protein